MITAWIGLVMLDLFTMLAPGLELHQRLRLVVWSRPFVVIAIPVIIATGVWQTIFNPITVVDSIDALEKLREGTVYGTALFWKHGFVLITFALTVYVRFVVAPRALVSGASDDGDQQSLVWLSLANGGACMGALLFATRMIWTLH